MLTANSKTGIKSHLIDTEDKSAFVLSLTYHMSTNSIQFFKHYFQNPSELTNKPNIPVKVKHKCP